MFIELVESNRKTSRSPAGALASVALHTGLIVVAIAATANARTNHERPIVDPTVVYIPQRTPDASARPVVKAARPAMRKPEEVSAAAPIVAPVTVATEIPAITAVPTVTEVAAVTGAPSSAIPVGTGVSGGGEITGPLTASQVDKEVRALRTNRPPSYPELLRAQGIEGEVLARYVVDEKGRVDTRTLEVMSASTPAFANAVRSALERARFEPAEAAGRKVAQLVEQKFQFRLN